MNLFDNESSILVTCAKAVEPFLTREMENLGYDATPAGPAAMETSGTLYDCMLLNLHLRTAHRVLYVLKRFEADSPDALYRQVSGIAWEDIIDSDGYVSVVASTRTEAVRDARFAGLRVKDAIVDRIAAKKGRRPNSGPDRSKSVVSLHWQDSTATIYIDTTGEPLSMRGYRKLPHLAPMRETLAAAAIMGAGFDGSGHFVNPMCGSGTLAIEAALVATNTAPGLLRDNFAFMHIIGHDRAQWESMRKDALSRVRKAPSGTIIATDIDPRAVDAARKNATAAGMDRHILFDVCDFRATQVPAPIPGSLVIMNPEYGQRLGNEADLAADYTAIGDFLKTNCKEYTGAVFTGNLALAKRIGLRTSARIPLYNGRIECRLLLFELYSGTRRTD
ncbi:putative N6-adenine-specific DNA methylase [Desulfobaculum xiamenense]|uniref:Putative N6-adenine-specific DNA methylase n=1 Tax=Desulfobaculum xiamenense TaxID=995050 RepID=A0A846QIM8_9BACT|nr:class I SAM-dependent RNA methyltransferase [Desulfobaculum xiamenense]NJB68021.1 putative N6-adenine-specific DNA methylase [Desulfobaculum xiamenense]